MIWYKIICKIFKFKNFHLANYESSHTVHPPICGFLISPKIGFCSQIGFCPDALYLILLVTSESRFSTLCVNYHAFTYFEYSSTNRATNYRASIICVFAYNMWVYDWVFLTWICNENQYTLWLNSRSAPELKSGNSINCIIA